MTPPCWLRILVYQNLPGVWVARSLEHDIAVEGDTSETAINRILEIVVAHIAFDRRHGRPPLSTFPEAPRRYWQAFGTAALLREVHWVGDEAGTDARRCVLIALSDARPFASPSPLMPDRRTELRVSQETPEGPMGPPMRAHHPTTLTAPPAN